ncbi:MAG: AbrB/MazE/SpoVT family DNA-binding domain-containing protein [Kiritimatiellae bacterium]|nr:AbrB/MazE/SpoVT family DNA-binding domain-containing protein [Kiritimatiellia bacterium]
MTTAKMCERGQITIPKQFRTQLGFQPGMVFEFHVRGKSLCMTVQKKKRNPFEEARGILKGVFGDMSTDELIREMRGC